METTQDIVIVGGGIAGLSVALALHRLGLKALVLESSDTLRAAGAAFTTWTNGWRALDALGVADSLRRQHIRHSRITVTSTATGVQTAEISYGDHEVRSVKRKVLLETLAKELPTNAIRFSSKVVSLEKSGYMKLLHLADGSTLKTKVVIGCDGVNSIVARELGFKKPLFTKRLAIRGYVDYKENHGLKPEFLQFMGQGCRYGILACDPTSLYWFFTWSPPNKEEEIQENPIQMKQFVLDNLGNVPDEIRAIIEKTEVEDLICSPLRLRPPWEVLWRDISRDNICVAGDAFHPMTPDLGQGACSALEDGIILARCLAEAFSAKSRIGSSDREKFDGDEYKKIETSLKKYAKQRKWRGAELIATAYLVGLMQQSDGKMIGFLRDKVLAKFLARLLLKKADFDCGTLKIP